MCTNCNYLYSSIIYFLYIYIFGEQYCIDYLLEEQWSRFSYTLSCVLWFSLQNIRYFYTAKQFAASVHELRPGSVLGGIGVNLPSRYCVPADGLCCCYPVGTFFAFGWRSSLQTYVISCLQDTPRPIRACPILIYRLLQPWVPVLYRS